MNNNPDSCDKFRFETLENLRYLDTGLDNILARCNYFDVVDNRSTVNNFYKLLRDSSKNCEKMANAKLWVPLHAQMNLENLIDQFGFNWSSKAEENFQHIKGVFDEIEEDFQKKGLKPAAVEGVPQYQPKNNPIPAIPNRLPPRPQPNQIKPKAQEEEEESDPILKDERLKNIDKQIAQRIINEVVHKKHETKWDDIAGLENVKQAINEIVVYPMQNPDLFQGLLAPAKGLLLFGPPGTGKTLIGKCIASESGATFFAISASSLTSKWVGEGEKMVRALFAVARCMQPSVVFIDEIDSLLTQRVDGEHDSTRRMKTEFLVQFDGVSTASDDRLLIVGATNRPQELDEAARRRFTKRIYIPLPETEARIQIVERLMSKGKSGLTKDCVRRIAEKTSGFSGADMATLCKEAALSSLRAVIRAKGSAKNLGNEDIPPIRESDFDAALKHVKASVTGTDLGIYDDWDRQFGASRER